MNKKSPIGIFVQGIIAQAEGLVEQAKIAKLAEEAAETQRLLLRNAFEFYALSADFCARVYGAKSPYTARLHRAAAACAISIGDNEEALRYATRGMSYTDDKREHGTLQELCLLAEGGDV